MDKDFNPQKKLIASVPLVLVSKEASIKIGKINDQINEERCILTKDPASKSYRLVEKKSNKDEARFTGTMMAEQSSKYLMFRFNQDTGKIEVSPGGDWHSFRKEINYPTMSIEEAEEKMKGKSGLLDYIRNKGVLTKPKKDKKKNKVDLSSGRLPFGRLNDDDEDMEDEVRQFLTEKVEEQSEEERPEDIDPELKEVDSDIEEAFIKGTKAKEEEAKTKSAANEEVEYSSDEDALFGDDEEDEAEDDEDVDEDQDFSDIDPDEDLTPEQENYIRLNTNKNNPEMIIEKSSSNFNRDQEFIGNKRKPEDSNLSSIRTSDKKQKTSYPLEEVLDNLFAKNKSMTHERIVKELLRSNFSKSEVETHLPNLLNRMCDKYPQGSEFYYFKKSEK